ncbi:MAG: hypothetical protein IKK24_05505 [Clostridia bacterium]|nr:hypothetical protein [Clostridia bacterium]
MPGFYINHLKSPRAKELAVEIEKKLAKPNVDRNLNISVYFTSYDSNDLDEILSAGYAVIRDHPEFFYFNTDLKAAFTGTRVSLHTSSLYPLSQIESLRQSINKKIDEIVSTIPPNATPWEKERRIFEYLQMNTKYVDDNAPERYNLVGALLQKEAVCEGISKAFAVLCHRVGIPCIIVFSENHMWNIVNINGKLSNVDATYFTSKPHSDCDYTFFNVPDSEMIKAQHFKEINCIPPCTDTSNSFYSKMNLSFTNEREAKNYVLKSLLLKQNPIRVKLLNGNIVRAIDSAAPFSPYGFVYSYNADAQTAIINLK